MADRRWRYAALMIEGELEIHAQDINGTYATLCGVDGDDPALGQGSAEMPKGAKITCLTCWQIFRQAKSLRATDFSKEVRARG